MSETNIPEGLYKAIERALDENSAWIARPSRNVTEAVARAAMNALSKRQRMHMAMDGCIETLRNIKAEAKP